MGRLFLFAAECRRPPPYTEERAQLTAEKNETYIISQSYVNQLSTNCQPTVNQLSTNCQPTVNQLSTNCQPSDNQMSAQYNIVDYSIIENNIENMSTPVDAQPRFDYQSVIDTFNSVCISLPKVKKLDDKRRKAIKSASKNLGDISFTDLFAKTILPTSAKS